MSIQVVISQKMILDGKPWTVSLIQNPTIDDVLVTEARLQAHNVEQGAVVTSDDRRVARDIRDYLIRFGVEH